MNICILYKASLPDRPPTAQLGRHLAATQLTWCITDRASVITRDWLTGKVTFREIRGVRQRDGYLQKQWADKTMQSQIAHSDMTLSAMLSVWFRIQLKDLFLHACAITLCLLASICSYLITTPLSPCLCLHSAEYKHTNTFSSCIRVCGPYTASHSSHWSQFLCICVTLTHAHSPYRPVFPNIYWAMAPPKTIYIVILINLTSF